MKSIRQMVVEGGSEEIRGLLLSGRQFKVLGLASKGKTAIQITTELDINHVQTVHACLAILRLKGYLVSNEDGTYASNASTREGS